MRFRTTQARAERGGAPLLLQRIASLRSALVALPLLLLATAGALQLGLYFHLVPWDFPRQDSLFELHEWWAGEPFWSRLQHNHSASHIQSLLLALDVYVGPYAYWSRAFAVAALGAGLGMLALPLVRLLGRDRALVLLAVLVGFWFSASNSVQTFSYLWRSVEVGCHVLCLGAGSLVLLAWSRGRTRPREVLPLLALLFVFSHAHKAFAYVLGLALLGGLLLGERRDRIGYLALGLGYLVYGFAIEGSLALLVSSGAEGVGPSLGKAGEYVWGVGAIGTAPIRDALQGLVPESGVAAARLLVALLVAWAAGAAAWRAWARRDWSAALALFVLAVHLAMVVVTVLARYPGYGSGIASVPRYWSDGLLVCFGALVFVGARAPRGVFWPVVLLLVVLAGNQTLQGVRVVPERSRAVRVTESLLYAHVLHPGRHWTGRHYNARHVQAFNDLKALLVVREVGPFGRPAFEARRDLEPPRFDALPRCEGELSVRRSKGAGVLSLVFAFDEDRSARIGMLWSRGELVGFGGGFSREGRRVVAIVAPYGVESARLVLYGSEGGAEPEPRCSVPFGARSRSPDARGGSPASEGPARPPPAPFAEGAEG